MLYLLLGRVVRPNNLIYRVARRVYVMRLGVDAHKRKDTVVTN